jgi:site-specific DNA-cytosine methylase
VGVRPDDLAGSGTQRQDIATAQAGQHHPEHRLGSRDFTHASFFSGVGGLDLGLERAGWRTVSFSEIDPYASAVLAERWPGVPNLGDITDLAGLRPLQRDGERPEPDAAEELRGRVQPRHGIPDATLWTGGFPCQDLSVAGKRRGMGTDDERTRSGLAFAFLDLVERHRPPAILLENVPGLLSSNGGKDFGALLGRLGQLGYWWAYRILDAQFFGVPQRRRRVFILALHAESGLGADSAAEVLSVGARCDGHSAAGDEARPDVAYSLAASTRGTGDQHGNLSARDYKSSNHLIGPSSDPGGVREADGLAGRLDDRPVVAYRKAARVNADPDSPESWVDDGLANTLNNFDVGGVRTTHAVVGFAQNQRGEVRELGEVMSQLTTGGGKPGEGYPAVMAPTTVAEGDPLLPLGLDSHRYRCCGNGVVSNVSQWIGHRLRAAIEANQERAA